MPTTSAAARAPPKCSGQYPPPRRAVRLCIRPARSDRPARSPLRAAHAATVVPHSMSNVRSTWTPSPTSAADTITSRNESVLIRGDVTKWSRNGGTVSARDRSRSRARRIASSGGLFCDIRAEPIAVRRSGATARVIRWSPGCCARSGQRPSPEYHRADGMVPGVWSPDSAGVRSFDGRGRRVVLMPPMPRRLPGQVSGMPGRLGRWPPSGYPPSSQE